MFFFLFNIKYVQTIHQLNIEAAFGKTESRPVTTLAAAAKAGITVTPIGNPTVQLTPAVITLAESKGITDATAAVAAAKTVTPASASDGSSSSSSGGGSSSSGSSSSDSESKPSDSGSIESKPSGSGTSFLYFYKNKSPTKAYFIGFVRLNIYIKLPLLFTLLCKPAPHIHSIFLTFIVEEINPRPMAHVLVWLAIFSFEST